jgi:hypothetical protein
VNDMLKQDFFLINKNSNNLMVTDLLSIDNHALKLSLCPVISIMASTLKGVEYLISQGLEITEKTIEILKD